MPTLPGYLFQVGLISSALEHAVPEQMFTNAQNPGEAISAVKALQKANAQGQRIYHITPANQATALPNIHHDSSTMAEIQNALNAGKDVITHTDAVSVPGWTGAGYIIFDADMGGGAFKIAGGANGSFFMGFAIGSALVSILALAALTIIAGGVAGATLIALIAFMLAPLVAVAVQNINNFLKIADPIAVACFWTGFTDALIIFGYIAGWKVTGQVVNSILTVIGFGLMWDANKTGTTGTKQCLEF